MMNVLSDGRSVNLWEAQIHNDEVSYKKGGERKSLIIFFNDRPNLACP